MPAGVDVLERLGIAPRLAGAQFRGIRYHLGAKCFSGEFPRIPALPSAGLGIRRRVLDDVLFREAAATPGVEARTSATVESPLLEHGRVTGLLVNGRPHRAALVVAADGVHSRLRQQLGLSVRPRRKRVGLRAHFRLSSRAETHEWVDVYLGRGHEVYVTPLPRGELLVAVLADAENIEGAALDYYRRCVVAQPELASRLAGSEPINELLAVSPLAGRSRRGSVPGLLFLGDAYGFLDPLTGGGMTQALTTAELLAEFVALRGCGDAWHAGFERQRRATLRDFERLTALMLWLSSHTRAARLALSGLAAAPSLFSHLIGVSGGVRRLLRPFSTAPYPLAPATPQKAPAGSPLPHASRESGAPPAPGAARGR
jgi:2-polyprenyl-6-methoxyphenol hydroxylase-like FAD-dependent oxidoreductase